MGAIFAAEPVLKPGGEVVQVRFLLECDTASLGVATLEAQAESLAAGGVAIQPGVNRLRLSQQVELRSGGVALAHVGDAEGVDGRVDYVFVVGEVR